MFIKKDLRKIDEILDDKSENGDSLNFSKRKAEFNGNVKALFYKDNIACYEKLKKLNLYDNALHDLNGVDTFTKYNILEDLNLGMNNISAIPFEFGKILSLKHVWLDDNELEQFPSSLCSLKYLKTLHLSNNMIQTLPRSISCLLNLELLALDNNELNDFPTGVLEMKELTTLNLRQNKIDELPDNISQLLNLKVLSVSSNKLIILPDCLSAMESLTHVYLNANKINSLPNDLLYLPKLEMLNLANNDIDSLPFMWMDLFDHLDMTQIIQIDRKTIQCRNSDKKVITVESSHTGNMKINISCNPFLVP